MHLVRSSAMSALMIGSLFVTAQGIATALPSSDTPSSSTPSHTEPQSSAAPEPTAIHSEITEVDSAQEVYDFQDQLRADGYTVKSEHRPGDGSILKIFVKQSKIGTVEVTTVEPDPESVLRVRVGFGWGVYVYMTGAETLTAYRYGFVGFSAAICSPAGPFGAVLCGLGSTWIWDRIEETVLNGGAYEANSCWEFTDFNGPKRVGREMCS